jgi:hypothetical protein
MNVTDEPVELNLGDDTPDPRPEVQELLRRIKVDLPKLEALYVDLEHQYQDRVYRYYHGSFKVYALQSATLQTVEMLRSLAPGRPLNASFEMILGEGAGKTWREGQNPNRNAEERHILEAFFHARYSLDVAIHYGKALEVAPSFLPQGWASVLYLFNLR